MSSFSSLFIDVEGGVLSCGKYKIHHIYHNKEEEREKKICRDKFVKIK